jgi:hypothetical protein
MRVLVDDSDLGSAAAPSAPAPPFRVPPDPPPGLTYTAPEFGYADHACRACGHGPCAVRLGWFDDRGRIRTRRYAYFCAAHMAEANRAHRTLKAGGMPPERP